MDINEQIVSALFDTFYEANLNKLFYTIGSPDEIEDSSVFKDAVKQFQIDPSDSVYVSSSVLYAWFQSL